MSDEQNHNDPLERLFRKKAEEYNISYREEDWLQLEKQLDARDMKLYYRRRLRWLAAASILILSLIGYYTFQNHNKINELTAQLNQSEQVQQNDQTANSQEDLILAENESDEPNDQGDALDESERSVTPNKSETAGQVQQQNAPINNDAESIVAVLEDETQTDQTENLSRRLFTEASQTIRQRPVQPDELFPNRSSMLANVNLENQPIELREASSNNGYYSRNRNSKTAISSAMLHGTLAHRTVTVLLQMDLEQIQDWQLVL